MTASRKSPLPPKKGAEKGPALEVRRADLEAAGIDSGDLDQALEWVLPLGVCCAEAQADGVPCAEIPGDCLDCERADPMRQLLLRLAASARIH